MAKDVPERATEAGAEGLYAPPRARVADIPPNESNIRVEYELKYLDYMLYVCVHQLCSVALQVFNGGVAAMAFFEFRDGGNLFALFAALVAYVLIWLLQFGFNFIYFLSRKNRSLLTRHVVEIQEAGFYESNPYSRSLHYWEGGVVRVVSRPGYVAVYINAIAAHVIPARAFANAAHRAGFVATIKARIRPA